MTKAIICRTCSDVLGPHPDWRTNRSWRWCSCVHVACRWRDGARGTIEVVSLHEPDDLRVIGLNNAVLQYAFSDRPLNDEGWRKLHEMQGQMVESGYLFHKEKRDCWALLVKPGESGDVFVMDYADAWRERLAGPGGADPKETDQ